MRYECVKSLLTLGSWSNDCLKMLVMYLNKGSSYVKLSLLKTAFSNRKHAIVEKQENYSEVIRQLINLSHHSQDEQVKFYSVVTISILGIYDVKIDARIATTAKENLLDRVANDSNLERRYISARTLIKSLSVVHETCLKAVMIQLRNASKWKFRREAAEMINLLKDISYGRSDVFDVLVKSLWDEPHKEVKISVVATISRLDMAPKTFEYVFKQLQHREYKVRYQAVKCLVTMAIKNETTLMALLDIIELDSSKTVRITAIKALVTLKFTDSRVFDALQERCTIRNDAADLDVSKEAENALKLLF